MIIFPRLTRTFHYGSRLQPARDWFVLLGIAAVLLVVSAAGNAFLFEKVKRGESLSPTATSTASTMFDESSLENVNQIFINRSQEEKKYREGSYIFTDPSR